MPSPCVGSGALAGGPSLSLSRPGPFTHKPSTRKAEELVGVYLYTTTQNNAYQVDVKKLHMLICEVHVSGKDHLLRRARSRC